MERSATAEARAKSTLRSMNHSVTITARATRPSDVEVSTQWVYTQRVRSPFLSDVIFLYSLKCFVDTLVCFSTLSVGKHQLLLLLL